MNFVDDGLCIMYSLVHPTTGVDIDLIKRVDMDSGVIISHEVEEGVS